MISRENIGKNLRDLATPRLSGTHDELKAFNLLKEKISSLDLKPNTQEFLFSTFYSRIYSKIAFSLASWLLLILLVEFSIAFKMINIIILAIVYLAGFIVTRKPERIKFGKILKSQNLYVNLEPRSVENEFKTQNVLIFSHLDSKGQRFIIKHRILIINLWIFTFSICLSLTLIYYGFPFLFLYVISFIFLCLNITMTFLININNTTNQSPGAIDNASGVVSNLELLEYFSVNQNKLDNYNLWFVFTGAEECGRMGIRHFYNEIIHGFDRNHTIIINIDGVGQGFNFFSNYMTKKKNPSLFHLMVKIGHKFGLNIIRSKAKLGVRSDGLYLRSKGFIEFGFGDASAHNFIHSDKDIINAVDTSVLKSLCDLISLFLKQVDQYPQKVISNSSTSELIG